MADAKRAPPRDAGAILLPVTAAGIAIAFLLSPIKKLGIWDPYELDAADLARRIAVNVFPAPPGAADPLRLEGAQNALPTLGDLRMGELPFTSMALSFRLFGLSEWAGRLPLALWGLAGAMAVYAFAARMIDRRAGLYAAAALVTMPLYFLHARTMLGDIVTMAALAFALTGLGGALLDRGLLPRSLWGALGLFGLAAGYMSRGLIIGVAIPALSVGLASLALEAGARRGRDAPRIPGAHIVGGLALGLGVAAAAAGLVLLRKTSPGAPVLRHLGLSILSRPAVETTFDLPLRDLGHGLFPWSAFLPFAVGRLFRPPPIDGEDRDAAIARERETAARVTLLVALGVGFAAYASVAPRAGALPWSGPAILALIAAIAIRDFERGAPPSIALGLGTVITGAVLYKDITRAPEKALAAFAVDRPAFPKSFEAQSDTMMLVAFAIFAGLVCLAWLEAPPDAGRFASPQWAKARKDAYVAGVRELSQVWGGNLVFVGVVILAALVGLGVMVFAGRRLGWAPVERLPKLFADVSVNAWWALPAAVFLLPIAYILVRDLYRALVVAARVPRALGTVLAALLAGGVLSFGYYPALAAQLSPKESFETLSRIAGPGEPLGLLGVRARAAAYYGSGTVLPFTEPARAFEWLTEGQRREDTRVPRRWLLFKADDLPRLNSLYRRDIGENLPVLDGRSSQILLGSNLLGDAPNQNPLASIVLEAEPSPARKLDASFRGELTVLGWEVTNMTGQVVDTVVPQTKYHIRFYYRVEQPISGNWKGFLHIDGFGRRYNGDHAVLDGRYPINLWNPGDLIVDDLVFQLEPNFLPGDYTVFFGFFYGDTRYNVTRGPAQDNRVIGGALRVR